MKQTETSPQTDWLSGVLFEAANLEQTLGDPDVLRATTRKLLQLAERTGAHMITGASQIGDQLAGAVASSSSHVRLWAKNGADGTVLVVEGLLATGVQIEKTARRARAAGATRVVAAAVLADAIARESTEQELGDQVFALEEIQLPRAAEGLLTLG